MTQHYPLMIEGAQTSDEILEVHAPYDDALIGSVVLPSNHTAGGSMVWFDNVT